MPVNSTAVAKAYASTLTSSAAGLAPRPAPQGPNFGDILSDTLNSTVQTLKKGEDVSMRSIAGKADINEVVTAVSNAEIALQAVIAVRDRVIQAYQEIIRMPI
jgi:flagellar hook-basal body complex protein FliE